MFIEENVNGKESGIFLVSVTKVRRSTFVSYRVM